VSVWVPVDARAGVLVGCLWVCPQRPLLAVLVCSSVGFPPFSFRSLVCVSSLGSMLCTPPLSVVVVVDVALAYDYCCGSGFRACGLLVERAVPMFDSCLLR